MKTIISTILITLSKVSHFTPVQNVITSGIPDNYFVFTAFGECDKFLYIGTNHGIFRKNKQNGKLIFLTQKNSDLPSNHVTSIICTREGYVYIGTQNGILMWDNHVFHLITTENSNIPDDNITALALDRDEDLWIGTARAGLVKSTGDAKKAFRTQPIQTNDKDIYSITVDPQGCIWVAFQNGVLEYFQKGNSHAYSSTPPIEKAQLNEAGTFLLNTYNQGTFLTDGNLFNNITIEPLCHNITCSYYNQKYSRMILCNEYGVNVFTISDPLSGHRNMSYSEFIRSILCRGKDKEITKMVNQLKEFEKDQNIKLSRVDV